MKSLSEQYNRYCRNLLDINETAEFNRQLVKVWFDPAIQLEQDVFEYATDLVLEHYIRNQLDPQKAGVVASLLNIDREFYQQWRLLSLMEEKAYSARDIHDSGRETTEASEIAAEKQLRETIQKIMPGMEDEKLLAGNVREDHPSSSTAASLPIRKSKVFLFRKNLWLIAASLTILTASVWYLAFHEKSQPENVGEMQPKAGEATTQSVKQETPVAEAVTTTPKGMDPKALASLLLRYFKPEAGFPITLMRGSELTATGDLFILAAEQYDMMRYDSSALLLKKLLTEHSVTDKDTLQEIYYYSGQCYLISGMMNGDERTLRAARQSFAKVDPENTRYNASVWYGALANLRSGNLKRGELMLEELRRKGYHRDGEVHSLLDSLKKQAGNRKGTKQGTPGK